MSNDESKYGGSTDANMTENVASGAGVPGNAGTPDDPNSATSRSEDNSDMVGEEASVRGVEASGNAIGPGQGQITTSEDSDESRSERSVGAETPADGTLG